jgi:hypothetical protein
MQLLPWRLVAKIGTVVQPRPTDQPIDGLWLEHWLAITSSAASLEGAVQLSELLGLVVLDAAAQCVGTVVDVGLTVDGDLDDNPDLPTMFVLVV